MAIRGLASPKVERFAASVDWIRLGALGALLKSLKGAGIREVVMQGQVKLKSVFSATPDLMGIRVMAGLREKSGEAILRAVGGLLARNGIRLLDCRTHMGEVLAGKGVLAGKETDTALKADLALGLKAARSLAKIEAGQTVVIKNGIVVALEGLEGTDACLKRAAKLAGKGCVAVKVSSSRSDFRFDIPTVGPRTLRVLASGGYKALAVESDRAFILGGETFMTKARSAGVTIHGF